MLLHDIIHEGAQKYPDNIALIFRDQPQTYKQLAATVNSVSRGFDALGIKPGDKIGLLLPNCPPFVWAYFAAAQIGAIVVPVNPLLKPAELEYIWRDADVCLVVTVAPLLPVVQAARQNLPALTQILCVTNRAELSDTSLAYLPGLSFLPEVMEEEATQGTGNREQGTDNTSAAFDQVTNHEPRATSRASTPLAGGEGHEPYEPRATNPNDCAVIIYTSGTTGHPKGAMLSHRNLTRNVEQIQAWLHILPDDRFLTVLPLFHAFAATVCMNLCLATGSASVLLENFAPARTLEVMAAQQVTIAPAVPAIFNALLSLPNADAYDTPRLRILISGGAPLPTPTLAALEARFGVPVLEGDGPTECSPVTSVNPLDGPRKQASVGPALPGVDVAIWNEQDQAVGVDEVGEIVVRGDNVMLGYLNQPEATNEAMTNGWYHTGDLGTLDADGYIFIVDRKKDMIITAGLNVYPREVEEVLLTYPGVADVAVVGQPNALRGEDVLAVVVLRPAGEGQAAVSERDLIRHCRERLANYKTPRRVLFRDTLPRGATGKVVKRLLKKELDLQPSGLDGE